MDDLSDEVRDYIDELQPLNINARYPSDKEMLYKLMDEEKSKYFLSKTKELQEWIKKKL